MYVASSPGLFFLLNDNENDKRNGWTHKKNRPGIYCRGSSAHVPTITQILDNRIRLFFAWILQYILQHILVLSFVIVLSVKLYRGY